MSTTNFNPSITGYFLNKTTLLDPKEENGLPVRVGKWLTSEAALLALTIGGVFTTVLSGVLSTLRLPFYLIGSERFSSLTDHTQGSFQATNSAFKKIFGYYPQHAQKEAPEQTGDQTALEESLPATPALPVEEPTPSFYQQHRKALLVTAGLATTAAAYYIGTHFLSHTLISASQTATCAYSGGQDHLCIASKANALQRLFWDPTTQCSLRRFVLNA